MIRGFRVRIAVLGAAGQLGSDLVRLLGDQAIPLGREAVDLADPDSIRSEIAAASPDVVVNCAAFNFVDRAEREPDAAFAVNAVAVEQMAHACRELDAVLVHVSTDYVFGQDAARKTPYRECDAPGPTCVYGASKLEGERRAASCPRHFVVRTCGLFGLAGQTSKKGNFVEMILRQVAENKPLRVVDDQRCSPTASADLAATILPLVATGKYGLYHATNAGDCTWYEFAKAILELSGIDRPIEPVSTAFFNSAAKRPGYSVLANDKLAAAGVTPLRPWRDALADYLSKRSSR
jgi:dTDP-4-dehydrorhamnose reductase